MENISPISAYIELIDKSRKILADIVILMNIHKSELPIYRSLCNEYLLICGTIHCYTNLIKDEISRMEKKASDIMKKI